MPLTVIWTVSINWNALKFKAADSFLVICQQGDLPPQVVDCCFRDICNDSEDGVWWCNKRNTLNIPTRNLCGEGIWELKKTKWAFPLRATDCYSLLKSGSLLSVCGVIEKFQPLFLPLSFTLLFFPLSMPTSLPPPQTSGLSFSLPASSLFASPFELSVMIRLTHSPPPPRPPAEF